MSDEPTLKEYRPSLKERMANALMGDSRPSPERRQFAQGLADIAYYVPGVGEAMAGDKIGRGVATGDYASALKAATGVIPGAGKFVTNRLPQPHADGGEVEGALRLAGGGPAWTRKEGQNPEGGLNAKGRASAKAQGHNLKPPAPHPKNEKDAARRKSFCSRMSGMKKKLTSSETANDPDSRINKSLRAWNCRSDGGEVWDKPRPKSAGKPHELSDSQKSSARAAAKAAGRPYPNLVDNMNAARKDREFGGAAYAAQQMQPMQPMASGGKTNSRLDKNPQWRMSLDDGGSAERPVLEGKNWDMPEAQIAEGPDNTRLVGSGVVAGDPEAKWRETSRAAAHDAMIESAMRDIQGRTPSTEEATPATPASRARTTPQNRYGSGATPYPEELTRVPEWQAPVRDVRPPRPGEYPSHGSTAANAFTYHAPQFVSEKGVEDILKSMRKRADGGEVESALRIAQRPISPVRFHQSLARSGYAEGGAPDEQAQQTADASQPDESSQQEFLKKELAGSAPQYEPEAGLHTAKEAGLMAAGMAPGAGIAAASGAWPTAEGGFEPSAKEDWQAGRYGSAAMKAAGAAGDVVSAVPLVGTAAGAAMKAPLAFKLATAMAPAAKLAREAAPAAKAVEEAAPVAKAAAEAAPEYQRLINPAGFYSRAHEVASTVLPEGPRTWQEMRSLMMKQPGMREEEMYWSGLHPEAYDPTHKLTREEIAAQVHKNFPQVSPVVKGAETEMRPMHEQYTVPGGENYNERVLTHEYHQGDEGTKAGSAAFEEFVPELRRLDEQAYSPNLSKEERQAARQQHQELYAKATAAAEQAAPEYTKGLFQHSAHLGEIENPILHTRNSERTIPGRGKVWHQEEVQSDWAQQGREQGFAKKNTLTPEEIAEHKELSKMPFSDYTPEQEARYNELTQRLTAGSTKGILEAPHVRDTEHWLDLAAKDTLKNAIEGGHDHIFITGGQEQAKRWSNELRKAVDNVRWESPNAAAQARDIASATEANAARQQEVAQILFNQDYANLTPQQQRLVARGMDASETTRGVPTDVPEGAKVVYARPVGSDTEHRFVVKQVEGPNGKPRVEVVDSSIPSAKGETLSAVVGGDLAKRIMAEEAGEQAMKGYRMGSEGYSQTYERKYPSSFKKLLKSLDPEAKIEAGALESKAAQYKGPEIGEDEFMEAINSLPAELDDDAELMAQIQHVGQKVEDGMPVSDAIGSSNANRVAELLGGSLTEAPEGVHGTWIPITPKMRAEYNRLKEKHGAVFPAYRKGGAVAKTENPRYTEALNLARKITG